MTSNTCVNLYNLLDPRCFLIKSIRSSVTLSYLTALSLVFKNDVRNASAIECARISNLLLVIWPSKRAWHKHSNDGRANARIKLLLAIPSWKQNTTIQCRRKWNVLTALFIQAINCKVLEHSLLLRCNRVLFSQRHKRRKLNRRENRDGRKRKSSVPFNSTSIELTLVSTRFNSDVRALRFHLQRFFSRSWKSGFSVHNRQNYVGTKALVI